MGEATGVVDLSGAEIRGDVEGRNPPIFLPRQPAASPLLALDIGGTSSLPPTLSARALPKFPAPFPLLNSGESRRDSDQAGVHGELRRRRRRGAAVRQVRAAPAP